MEPRLLYNLRLAIFKEHTSWDLDRNVLQCFLDGTSSVASERWEEGMKLTRPRVLRMGSATLGSNSEREHYAYNTENVRRAVSYNRKEGMCKN